MISQYTPCQSLCLFLQIIVTDEAKSRLQGVYSKVGGGGSCQMLNKQTHNMLYM